MAKLGQLVIELAANTARLQSDMGKAIGIAEKASSRIKTAFKFAGGGLIGAALVNTVKQSIQFGDAISKAATKAGLGAKAMSELAYAAKLADVDIASLSTALKKMQVSLSEAGTGATGPAQALQALGLTFENLQKRKPDAQFELLAKRISELKDPADKARAATELFGKAGADLLPLFEQGAAGIRKAREEAQKLGLSFNDEQIKRLADADEATKRLSASWQGFATTMTAKVAPALSRVLDLLSGVDNRTTEERLAEEIGSRRARINNLNLEIGGFGGGRFEGSPILRWEAEKKQLEAEIAQLEARRDLLGQPRLGTGEPSRGRFSGSSIGFQAAAASDAAAEASVKAAEERMKRLENAAKTLSQNMGRTFENFAEAEQNAAEGAAAEVNALTEAAKAAQKEFAKLRQEQLNKLSDAAQTFKDAFMNAWDDMVNTGKFKWDELLKYLLAEFARRGIAKLFDSLFLSKEGGGKGWGGALDSALNWGKKLLGFSEGGRPPMNKPSIVGEKGPELWWPDSAGTIVPNYGMAAGGVNVTINMDNRGASQELIRVLPAFGRELASTIEARVVDGLKRRKYRFT